MAPTTPSYLRLTEATSFTGGTSTPAPTRRQAVKNAAVRDVDFEETQLIPRGVEIYRTVNQNHVSVAGAYAYFGSETPPDSVNSREFYRSVVQKSLTGRVERDIDDSIFLSMDCVFVEYVCTVYRSLGEADVPESEFKICAFQNLFIGEYTLLANDATRPLCAIRSAEWSLKPCRSPQQSEWLAPPLSPDHSSLKPLGFDIYSGCQFWLCHKILNASYRTKAGLFVHCKRKGTFCPYFSIEFKATTDDMRTMVNQLAAVGLISLFNRYHLKLKAHPPRLALEQLEHVRHGLTMERQNWMVDLFESKIASGAWAGFGCEEDIRF
ncbi:uncharacterized protein Z518_09164 [Rhinocladiella mackenziei CBS 650.93]|uniref:Uncharacterized protein n=1 Tax=Rhinocladiella mackenziei CBS 650.93 TaxID=1442369 RepID=A0A0D2GSV6_9EURO|nr:uncharacterized protein Z518_09164 [Rhinocladiella mackenziei CBS 650.93]KIX01438.1 hypothetical protein Z518_09164 [Rhinocladiella mackenziei CBS 650.93]